MIVNEIFDETNFDDLGWNDCRVYRFDVPDEDNQLKIDIDYIFKWEKGIDTYSGFWVSPCDLVFKGVNYLKVNLDFQNNMFLDILEIKRGNKRLSPNKAVYLWDYRIEFDNGCIQFTSSGFELLVRKQPLLSESQDLGR